MTDITDKLVAALEEIQRKTARKLDMGSEEDFDFNEIDDIAAAALAAHREAKARPQGPVYVGMDIGSGDYSVEATLDRDGKILDVRKLPSTAQPQEPGEFDELVKWLKSASYNSSQGAKAYVNDWWKIMAEAAEAITSLTARLREAEAECKRLTALVQVPAITEDDLRLATAKALEEAVQAVLDAGGDNADYHAAAIRAL